MKFGTRFLSDNKIEFNFWAPDSKRAFLCLKNPDNTGFLLPMKTQKNGWFQITTDNASVGSKYQFQIDNGMLVPDPASRYQAEDVHGPSVVINPAEFDWGNDYIWNGKNWNEAVIYEIHTGTFSKEGTFKGIKDKLDYLASLGVTAIELMPIADFPGRRNWGYDGVLLFAPESNYGTPDDLKELIKVAHEKGIAVILDVVYNHLGPEGNYLYVYARSQFFDLTEKNAWGDAINFNNKTVRNFFIQNALYWLEEYHFDGLRFDAVHAIKNNLRTLLLEEIHNTVKEKIDRNIWLILENDDNEAKYLKTYSAQWTDDFHHSMTALIKKERESYFIDYSDKPVYYLAKTIAEGFAYQGESSPFRGNTPRGENSKNLSTTSFVYYMQNHDIVGNRVFSERIHKVIPNNALRAVTCINLLTPSIPMLFMGEEFNCDSPFYFFCDFEEGLNKAVKEGRQKEFSSFSEFSDINLLTKVPCLTTEDAFLDSKIRWGELEEDTHRNILEFYKELIAIRKKHIVPIIPKIEHNKTKYEILNDKSFLIQWQTKRGETLELLANLGKEEVRYDREAFGELIAESQKDSFLELKNQKILTNYGVYWFLNGNSKAK